MYTHGENFLANSFDRSFVERFGDAPDEVVVKTITNSLCDAPQYWSGLSTDTDGNVYIVSTFQIAADDGRPAVTKYDPALNLVWRAFGLPKSVNLGENASYGVADMPYDLHVGPHGITLRQDAPGDPQSEFTRRHPVFSRFSAAGDLLWARAVVRPDPQGRGPLPPQWIGQRRHDGPGTGIQRPVTADEDRHPPAVGTGDEHVHDRLPVTGAQVLGQTCPLDADRRGHPDAVHADLAADQRRGGIGRRLRAAIGVRVVVEVDAPTAGRRGTRAEPDLSGLSCLHCNTSIDNAG